MMKQVKSASFTFTVIYVVILLQPSFSSGSDSRIASVVLDGLEYVIKEGAHTGSIATGNFTDLIAETGWSYLTIDTNGDYDDFTQAYAAGFLEGNLTSHLIRMMWNNSMKDFCLKRTTKCNAIKAFLGKNVVWMWNQIRSFGTNIYWHQVGLVLQQLVGMEASYYNKRTFLKQEINVDVFGLFLLQMKEELDDIQSILGFPPNKKSRPVGSGSCSALVKLLPNNSDLYVAHDTWSPYNSMLRIIKKYNFAYKQGNTSSYVIPGKEIAFSSYPGILHSVDDYYITHLNMVVMETTIPNYNPDLWKYSTYRSLLTWIRVTVALRVANNALQWAEVFREYNMGTYNNQWMLIDYSKFTPGKEPEDGLFTVVEQLPGYVEAKDFTEDLYLEKNSYWASYNLPYFKQIYEMSGLPAMFKQEGNMFSYSNCPRAQIFRRNQTDVVDMDSMLRLMRYNNFQNDPLGACNCTPPFSGENAISARSDLNPKNGSYPLQMLGHLCHGGTDSKITSSSMSKTMSFVAVCGPTWDQQEPFQWSKSDYNTVPHEGLPDKFKFDPVNVDWNV